MLQNLVTQEIVTAEELIADLKQQQIRERLSVLYKELGELKKMDLNLDKEKQERLQECNTLYCSNFQSLGGWRNHKSLSDSSNIVVSRTKFLN